MHCEFFSKRFLNDTPFVAVVWLIIFATSGYPLADLLLLVSSKYIRVYAEYILQLENLKRSKIYWILCNVSGAKKRSWSAVSLWGAIAKQGTNLPISS